jgi:seryl-tRNA synthetase
MSWKAVEDVRQLQQDYERTVKQYQEIEAAYRDAKARKDDEAASRLLAELEGMYPQMQSLYQRLNAARGDLASVASPLP